MWDGRAGGGGEGLHPNGTPTRPSSPDRPVGCMRLGAWDGLCTIGAGARGYSPNARFWPLGEYPLAPAEREEGGGEWDALLLDAAWPVEVRRGQKLVQLQLFGRQVRHGLGAVVG